MLIKIRHKVQQFKYATDKNGPADFAMAGMILW